MNGPRRMGGVRREDEAERLLGLPTQFTQWLLCSNLLLPRIGLTGPAVLGLPLSTPTSPKLARKRKKRRKKRNSLFEAAAAAAVGLNQ